jgi:hypothetical protein
MEAANTFFSRCHLEAANEVLSAGSGIGAAGRIDWLMGWIYLGLFTFFSLGSRVLVLRKNPNLIADRAAV